jgi:hypothetical protein
VVTYEDVLPLVWQPGLPGAAELQRIVCSGRNVLEAVAAMEEGGPDRSGDDSAELYEELARIDAKLQLLLDMVARLRNADGPNALPSPRPVILAADRIRFEPGDAVQTGRGLLSIHLHPSVPEPLTLPGQLSGVSHETARGWFELCPVDERWPFREALSRHVFRHHRRNIAATRGQGND